MERICRDCGDEFDDTHPFHARNGFIDQCGHCAEDEEEDRVVALEEPSGNKMSCEVMPVHRDALTGGVGRHVRWTQRHQPIGCKRN